MVLTMYYTAFHPVYLPDLVRKGMETGRFSQMVRKSREFHSERKMRLSTFPKSFSGKLPFHSVDLKPKFPEFSAKW